MIMENNLMGVSLLLPRDAHPKSKQNYIDDGEQVRVIFQLLRQVDPSISMVWHSIWHGSEWTP